MGILILLGWILKYDPIKNILPNAATMKFNTALGFLVSGISLWLLQKEDVRRNRIGRTLSYVVLAIGLITLIEYTTGWNAGIDQLFIRDLGTPVDAFPGRMTEITAICFVLVSLALLAIDSKASSYFSVIVIILSLLAVIGYLFNYQSLYQLPGYGTIALHTAITFLLLSSAIFAARPSHGLIKMLASDLMGSRLLRLLLPTSTVLIILLGWLVEQGDKHGILNSSNESVILVVLLIFIYLPLIYLYSERINRSEEEIEISEERYRSTLDYMLEGCQIIDFDWRYVYINKAAARQGRRGAGELVHHTMMEIYPGIENTELFTVLRDCMENRVARQVENEFTYPAGTTGWFQLSIQPVPEGIFILSVDLTKRKQAEEKIQDMSFFPEENPSPVLRVDASGKIVYANIASRLLLVEWHCEVGEELPSRWKELAIHLITTGSGEIVEVQCGELTYSIMFAPVSDRGYINLYGRDITERKQAMANLATSETRLTSIIDSAMDAIISVNVDQKIILVNRTTELMFGYKEHELIGQSLEMLIPQPLREIHQRHIEQFGRTGVTNRSMNELGSVSGLRSNGEAFPAEASISQVTVEGQKIYTVILRDITERKHAEAELKDAMQDLKRSNAELEQFAYVASHDLQEPLRMVSSYLQLLSRRYQGKLDSDADEFIDFAVDGARRMQRLIEDLLAFSRIGTRGKPFEQVNANLALDKALANLTVTIEETSSKIMRSELPTLNADQTQLVQLFQNLIVNGIKFHKTDETPKVEISAVQEGNEWKFAVQDNGIGIDLQFAERIFVIFQRLHPRTEYPGTGIGLAICKKIVERHGGRIWVESKPDAGATFYFTFPTTKAGGQE
jgi:PAS domain S-box-containing protein